MTAPMRGGGALEGHVQPVAQRVGLALQHVGMFIDSHRLARECRFVNLELGRFDEPQISRDLVARFKQHDVARHQRLRRHLLHLAGAQHRRLGCRQPLQRRQRLIGAP
ncbi:hypothetical protein GALL_522370 [mine drainage metagenome]|uniref:Uncharacterized protein n=1 Tax=mine drainage metagenome TaxID=410659 RepID=A0A1J5PRJ5_9ZZZZ